MQTTRKFVSSCSDGCVYCRSNLMTCLTNLTKEPDTNNSLLSALDSSTHSRPPPITYFQINNASKNANNNKRANML